MSEYVVVMTQIVGNVHHYEFVSSVISRHRTLAAAKRNGIAELGHDDFNIAILRAGKLARWTWMGEDIEDEDLDAIADRLGWQVAS